MILDGLAGAGGPVASAIRSASRSTGAPFDYLLKTAMRESALDPGAKAPTSSARGLFQFIESTWLATLKEDGARFGLSRYAEAIERTPSGEYIVRNPSVRARILKLRDDPQISALMAGALAGRNEQELARALGRKPSAGELYIAHFLGAGGAKRLLALNRHHPRAAAAEAFPAAARANQSVFYRPDGSARTAKEVYQALTVLHDAPEPRRTDLARVAGTGLPPHGARASTSSEATVLAFAEPQPGPSPIAKQVAPVFEGLFRDGSEAPLSPAVRDLWGALDERPVAVATRKALGRPHDLSLHLQPAIQQSGRRTLLGS